MPHTVRRPFRARADMGAKLKERVRAAVGEVKERVRAAGGRALRCVATSWVPCVTLAWLWIACFPLVSARRSRAKEDFSIGSNSLPSLLVVCFFL